MVTERELKELSWPNRLARLVCGLAILTLLVGLLISGVTPPGIAGEVLRHNRSAGIDASPLFYSEVEHMPELEASLRLRRQQSGR